MAFNSAFKGLMDYFNICNFRKHE